jgi:phosphohistidine phosphatase SixA
MIRRFRLPLLAASLLAFPVAGAAQHAHAPAAAPTTVIVVRHAEKSTADPADRDPVLAPAGQARAEALVSAVRGAGVDAVITTQFKRTRMTGQVLADSLKLTPEVVAAGPNHIQEVTAAIRKHAGHTVLVVGHSNTVPAIIAALGGPRLPDLCDSQYSDMFVLVLDGSQQPPLIRSTYGAPSPAPGPECNPATRQ